MSVRSSRESWRRQKMLLLQPPHPPAPWRPLQDQPDTSRADEPSITHHSWMELNHRLCCQQKPSLLLLTHANSSPDGKTSLCVQCFTSSERYGPAILYQCFQFNLFFWPFIFCFKNSGLEYHSSVQSQLVFFYKRFFYTLDPYRKRLISDFIF